MVQIRRPKKSYEEHRKEFAAARRLETSLDEAEAGVGAEPSPAIAPAEEAPATPPPSAPGIGPAARPRRAADGDAKLRLKFTVAAPLPGAFDYFDRAVALMGDGRALRLVLARAFDDLEAAVEAGEELSRETYPVDPNRSANTSRHTSAALHARAKATLDPMDLLPPSSFGRELAMAALARFLKGK